MSYQEPYTFDERKETRKLRIELDSVFSKCNDEEVKEWLNDYKIKTIDLIRLLRMLQEK